MLFLVGYQIQEDGLDLAKMKVLLYTPPFFHLEHLGILMRLQAVGNG